MRSLLAFALLLSACSSTSREISTSDAASGQAAVTRLSAEEAAEGFRLLFDGQTASQWRGYRSDSFPATGWEIADGELRLSEGGGDIITRDRFANFELRLQWKISEGGNSGIFYRVTEEAGAPYETGSEMQILDDLRHRDGESRLTSAGSNFGLYASPEGIVHPAGEWNDAGIIADGAHVEHWLNGTRVVEYELWSDEWVDLVTHSKFAQWPGYGMAHSGYIGLQDHGDVVSFRSIRIKELP